MMQYDGELHLPTHFLVPPPDIERTSGQYLVHNGIATFACSEARSVYKQILQFVTSLLFLEEMLEPCLQRRVQPAACSQCSERQFQDP